MNEKKLSETEIKKISLEILLDVANFCDKNNITYFLGYGTLLGAIRHGGYIPWDDDIDIVMPREDYERFKNIYYSNEKNRYKIYTVETDPNYHLPFMKVVDMQTVKREEIDNYRDIRGIEIDVFPLDGLSNDLALAKKRVAYTLFLMKFRNLATYKDYGSSSIKNAIGKKVCKVFCKLLGTKFWIRRIEKACIKYSFNESEYVGNITTINYQEKQITNKEIYSSSVEVGFEGYKFKVPYDYDILLRQLYGDYMKLPPKEKQVTHHNYIAHYKH